MRPLTEIRQRATDPVFFIPLILAICGIGLFFASAYTAYRSSGTPSLWHVIVLPALTGALLVVAGIAWLRAAHVQQRTKITVRQTWNELLRRCARPTFLAPFLLAICGIVLFSIAAPDHKPPFLITIAPPVVIGVLLTFAGIAWLRIEPEPSALQICHFCEYDLLAHQELNDRCPECGMYASEAQNRRILACLALALPAALFILVSLLCFAFAGFFWNVWREGDLHAASAFYSNALPSLCASSSFFVCP